jgi:hypothetical protein
MKLRALAAVTATMAAALVLTASAAADQPEVIGPITTQIQFPFFACGFEADVSITDTFENRIFSNPTFNIDYYREVGTITNPATGTTLEINDHWTEVGRPPTNPDEGLGKFAQHGVSFHIVAPGGGVVLIKAGYVLYRYPDGLVFVQHGIDTTGALAELCAALAA